MTPTWAHGAFTRVLDVGHDGGVYTKQMGKCHESRVFVFNLCLGARLAAHQQAALQTPLSSLQLVVFLENSTRCHRMSREALCECRESLGKGLDHLFHNGPDFHPFIYL